MAKRPSSDTEQYQYATTANDIGGERLDSTTKPNARAYTVGRRGRYWEVLDPTGRLICLTVYKRGAAEVIRRLSA